LFAGAWNISDAWNNCRLRKLKSDAYTLRDFAAKDRIFADFVVVVAHVLAAPSKPEIAKSIRAGCVIPQVRVAESAEGVKAAPFDSESFQNRVQAAAQDVALAERLPITRAEDVAARAATDEVGKQLCHVRVEVNDAIGVLCLGCLSIASPHGLLDLDATAIEVPYFKAEQFTGSKTGRRSEDEKYFHFGLDRRDNLRNLFPSKRGSALFSSVNDRCVDKLRVPFHRIEFVAVVIHTTRLHELALVDDVMSWPPQGSLKLDGFAYQRIFIGPKKARARLRWLELQSDFTPQPYRQLAKVLRDDGDNAGAQEVLFEMERRRRKKEDLSKFQKFWSTVLKSTVGYGYHPAWALRYLLASTLLGFFLYYVGYSAGSIVPADPAAYGVFKPNHQLLPVHYEHFHASMYSLENSFPLVKLGQVDFWRPDPAPERFVEWVGNRPARFSVRVSVAGFLRWFRWTQIIFGWFFATLWVAAVTGFVRRD
jgi:hypothetical protein